MTSIRHLMNRQLDIASPSLTSFATHQFPQVAKEYRINHLDCDKIFASEWLDSQNVILGAKDHQLIVLNVVTNVTKKVPHPTVCIQANWLEKRWKVPSGARDSDLDSDLSSDDETSSDESMETASMDTESEMSVSSASVASEMSTSESDYSDYISTASDEIPTTQDRQDFMPTYFPSRSPCTGVRAICVNQSKTIMAVAVGYLETVERGHSFDASIWFYSFPDLKPLFRVKNTHQDAIFQLVFISDNLLTTASRDGYTCMWKISFEPLKFDEVNFVEPTNETEKVRDLNLLPGNYMATLHTTPTGTVSLLNQETFVCAQQYEIKNSIDLTCMSNSGDMAPLLAVGSQTHVTLLDCRLPEPIQSIPSLDDGFGVRCILWDSPFGSRENVLTIGGGSSKVSFYDIRAKSYLRWQEDEKVGKVCVWQGTIDPSDYRWHLESLRGVAPDLRYWGVKNAIYTMKYDGGRLLCAGGPLHTAIAGPYCSLFM